MHMHNKQFSKIKNYKSRMAHTSIRTGAPQVTYFVDYTREIFYEGPKGKYIITEHFLRVD